MRASRLAGADQYGSLVWVTAPLGAACALLAYARRQKIKGLAAAIRR